MSNQVPQPGNYEPSEYYDAFAPQYDEVSTAANWPAKAAVLIGRVFEREPDHAIRSVLDIGGGTGTSLTVTLQNTQPEHVVIVDVSREMLRRNTHANAPGARTVVAKAEEFVEDCSERFDLITALGVLEFVPDLPAFLGRTASLLEKDGMLAFTYVPLEADMASHETRLSPDIDRSLTEYRWLPDSIHQALEAANIEIIDKMDGIQAYDLGERAVHYNFLTGRQTS